MTEAYRDSRQIAFSDYLDAMPACRPGLWKYTNIKKDLDNTCLEFHNDWAGHICWMCGANTKSIDGHKHQLHHLMEGSRGKSYQRFLYVLACDHCHRNRVTEADLGRWLYLKWKHERHHTDWCDLAARYGRALPDLITD